MINILKYRCFIINDFIISSKKYDWDYGSDLSYAGLCWLIREYVAKKRLFKESIDTRLIKNIFLDTFISEFTAFLEINNIIKISSRNRMVTFNEQFYQI